MNSQPTWRERSKEFDRLLAECVFGKGDDAPLKSFIEEQLSEERRRTIEECIKVLSAFKDIEPLVVALQAIEQA